MTSKPQPQLLEAIDRGAQRQRLGIVPDSAPPFHGTDVWNAWEFTWLGPTGKPEVAVARLEVSALSPRLIESKSMKLYLGSFSEVQFASQDEAVSALAADLTSAAGAEVKATLLSPEAIQQAGIAEPQAQCLDSLDVEITTYTYQPNLLELQGSAAKPVQRALYTRLFKSLCPLTGQPDFADVCIAYKGPAISEPSLLRYLVSYRQHAEFAEQVAERIFCDLSQRCAPRALTVTAHYTRRGGIDINPTRSTTAAVPATPRHWRQ